MAKEWGIIDKIVRIGWNKAANMAKAFSCFWADNVHDFAEQSLTGDKILQMNIQLKKKLIISWIRIMKQRRFQIALWKLQS